MNPLYSLGIWVYRQGVRCAAALGHKKAALLNTGLDATFANLEKNVGRHDRNIWFHAASLGEFEQGRPLMERLRREHPELKIILTFFSPSGYEVRKNFKGADIIAYLPFDTPANVKRFLDIVNPEKAFIIKYEFWLNYLAQLRRRGIETYLISGIFRPSQLFFKKYGRFYRNALRSFKTLYVQDHGSRRLLEEIGITNVVVAGDTRFDRVTDIMNSAHTDPILDIFCNGRNKEDRDATPEHSLIFMAGSSWPEDEAVYGEWLKSETGVKGVIAPHEFDESRLKALLDRFGNQAILLSDLRAIADNAKTATQGAEDRKTPDADIEDLIKKNLEGKRILIIDCFGLLSSAYAYADIAYVGGAFGAGLHNINEAAVYGIPVIYGPNHSKFIEAEEMKTLGGGIAISSADAFARNARRLVRDPLERRKRGRWAGEYIHSKLGATDKIYSDIFT